MGVRTGGKPTVRQLTVPLTHDTGSETTEQSFLFVPEHPTPLTGPDLLIQLEASGFPRGGDVESQWGKTRGLVY